MSTIKLNNGKIVEPNSLVAGINSTINENIINKESNYQFKVHLNVVKYRLN